MSNTTTPNRLIVQDIDGSLLLFRDGKPRQAVRIEPDELSYIATALVACMAIAMRQAQRDTTGRNYPHDHQEIS